MGRIKQQPAWLRVGDLSITFMFPVFFEEIDEPASQQEAAVS